MCMALLEAIICHALCAWIFRPCYVLDSSDTANILDLLFEEDSRRETLLRCQLVALDHLDDSEARTSDAAAETASRVFSPGRDPPEEFLVDLKLLFQEGIELWRGVRSGTTPIYIEELDDEDGDWNEEDNRRNDYDNMVPLSEDQKRFRPKIANPIAMLFPRVLIGQEILLPGVAFWTTQNAAVAAMIAHQESDKRIAGSQVPTRQRTFRRRMSDTHTRSLMARNPRSEEVFPTSQISPTNSSFMEHANSQFGNRSLGSSRTTRSPEFDRYSNNRNSVS